ncbi:MAG: M48 family metalloprotease [Nitrospirae bacterium]|nr:M48 family metalloprotease [Nitrospirota bacterium]
MIRIAWLLLVLQGSVSACSGLPIAHAWATGGGRSSSLTNSQEEEIGRRFNGQVRDYLKLVRDPDVQDYLDGFGGSLLKPIEPQPFHYRFTAVEDDDINAYAVPGGYVYVNTGLLTIIDTPDELASVLSHEIAHVNKHHASQSFSKNNLLDIGMMAAILGSMFLAPDNPKAAMGIMAGAVGANAQAKYAFSRQQEREADAEGMRYMRKGGRDTRGMQSLFEKMKLATRLSPTGLPPYLLTHPLEEERIRSAAAPPEEGEAPARPFDLAFEKFRTLLRVRYSPGGASLIPSYEKDAETKKDDTSRYLLALAYFAAGRPANAIEQFKQLGAEFRNKPYVERDLGRVYFEMGQTDAAIERFRASAAAYPSDYLSALSLAKALETKGQADEAIALYRRAVEQRRSSAEANYQLGVLYGKRESLGPAHYYLALSFLANDDPEKALVHFKKSISFFGEDSPDGKRIKREMREIFRE